ncbi:hypothetical protein, conserved in T. vivax [Trypanosoma vivax Y486]|uniref:Uncharacterized protein n=1 Tax=Trypanosoma vivax (strain Y486) TaxID=1055687 RepID=F9WTG8_TRYVY|nr:hypothetical protein, conserved in T. vivax [Trypanosoma vivax Y486]|eukprot:CCD20861.1 hypothetical protein, conserved in T. vivax [Trypanosoma vivax Y486]
MKYLNETDISIGSLTTEACDKGLSKVFNGSLAVAFSRAAGLNSSGMAKAQEALKKLKAEAALVNAKLAYINGSLQQAEKAVQDVDQHDEAAMSTVKNSIVEVVSGAMKDLCETMKGLYTLRLASTSLNEEAEGILGNVSVLVGLSNVTRNKMNKAVKTVPNAAEYFGVANRELVVFARATNKIEKLRSTVQGEISSFLEEQMKYEKRINVTHADFMKKLFTNRSLLPLGVILQRSLTASVGRAWRLLRLMQMLLLPSLTLQNLTNIGALNAMSKGIKSKVGKMRESLKKASAIFRQRGGSSKEQLKWLCRTMQGGTAPLSTCSCSTLCVGSCKAAITPLHFPPPSRPAAFHYHAIIRCRPVVSRFFIALYFYIYVNFGKGANVFNSLFPPLFISCISGVNLKQREAIRLPRIPSFYSRLH